MNILQNYFFDLINNVYIKLDQLTQNIIHIKNNNNKNPNDNIDINNNNNNKNINNNVKNENNKENQCNE